MAEAKGHVRVILLVIASHDEVYDHMAGLWRRYMHGSKDVLSLFVYSDPTLQQDVELRGDCLYHRSEESHRPGIFCKSTAALVYCEMHYSYDYIFRTNLSSCVILPRLLNYLDKAPPRRFCAATLYRLPDGPAGDVSRIMVRQYLGKGSSFHFIFLHGAGMLLSRDVVQRYIQEIVSPDVRLYILAALPDDVSISVVLYRFLTLTDRQDHPIEFVSLERMTCNRLLPESDYAPLKPDVFHLRNRVDDSTYENNTLERRRIDLTNYERQVDYFYRL